ncbi:unnamed protein product [Vitrella brassicaformis CCMP3155]|uniref:Uncharacterized protein n=1 Tax=Vitrella brassicaformis (strain CCMP3155) TaxID=1169540 RepID=A0A0G4GCF1_VITBC|nr:unnamed protein product [Vitrella brassicaformis CCMP3155]|mmetsp:Transcript_3885/g.8875  ORF Transcript_3885/g.8875 Transcript_3885/m.8875 type:complete len:306 (-) Transcript_3885:107-1024(-)|eukprot:CEM26947.1 unnamed protein product [Vitrella brassicaformis CCMP3155]
MAYLRSSAFDSVEDWLGSAFQPGSTEEISPEEEHEAAVDLSRRRKGIKYFTAARHTDRPSTSFYSRSFPMYSPDALEGYYQEVFSDVLRLAGDKVDARTRHKMPFDGGVLYFSADSRANLFGLFASEDVPTTVAFRCLWQAMDVFDDLSVDTALDTIDATLRFDHDFMRDAFGVAPLMDEIWQRWARVGDGQAFQASDFDYSRRFPPTCAEDDLDENSPVSMEAHSPLSRKRARQPSMDPSEQPHAGASPRPSSAHADGDSFSGEGDAGRESWSPEKGVVQATAGEERRMSSPESSPVKRMSVPD